MRTWTANEAKINPIPVTSIKGMKASAENIGECRARWWSCVGKWGGVHLCVLAHLQ